MNDVGCELTCFLVQFFWRTVPELISPQQKNRKELRTCYINSVALLHLEQHGHQKIFGLHGWHCAMLNLPERSNSDMLVHNGCRLFFLRGTD